MITVQRQRSHVDFAMKLNQQDCLLRLCHWPSKRKRLSRIRCARCGPLVATVASLLYSSGQGGAFTAHGLSLVCLAQPLEVGRAATYFAIPSHTVASSTSSCATAMGPNGSGWDSPHRDRSSQRSTVMSPSAGGWVRGASCC